MQVNQAGRCVLLLFVFIFVSACSVTHATLANYDLNRIVNGVDVSNGKYPFQVSLQNLRRVHICGGTILNADTVLTAGHCFSLGDIPENILVVTSTSDLRERGRIYRVRTIIRHRGFSDTETPVKGKVIINDIALLKITTRFALTNGEGVVKLPRRRLRMNGGEATVAIGWGQTATVNNAMILQEASMTVVNDMTCDRKYYGNVNVVDPPQHVCAVGGNKGPCMGDSGGPLILHSTGEQVGIVSFGVVPCGPGPTLFTEVANFLDWINANIAG